MFFLFSLECPTKTKEAEFLVDEIHITNEFYLWTSNCFLCHREYIINASEFHYNTFEKTKVFNEFHVYDSSNDFYTNGIYLKLRRLVSI